MQGIQPVGDETREQLLERLEQSGHRQNTRWNNTVVAIAFGMLFFTFGQEILTRGKGIGDLFWCLYGAVTIPPLVYLMIRLLGYGPPTAFDREVIDLLIVRDEDTAAIWTSVYGLLRRSSHPVFREYIVRELSAGRELSAPREKLCRIFRRELGRAWFKTEVPANYVRLIAGYLRRYGSEEDLAEVKQFYCLRQSRDPLKTELQTAILQGLEEHERCRPLPPERGDE